MPRTPPTVTSPCVPSAVLALAFAVAPAAAEGAIQDNSFLLEEAYNQEDRVVQHIGTFERARGTGDWIATFTQEWPVGGQKHQFSLTASATRVGGPSAGSTGAGEALLNWRYQIVGSGRTPVAFAPRLSLVVPTGNERAGRGDGAVGLQANLPLSASLGERFTTHVNLGATWIPRARSAAGEKAGLTGWNMGQSFIWAPTSHFNVMSEFVFETSRVVVGPGTTAREESFVVNPGVRWAHDFASGLQIVPGIAVPVGLGPSRAERSIFLYLSFEHPF